MPRSGFAGDSRPCRETLPGSPMDTTSAGMALFAADRAEQIEQTSSLLAGGRDVDGYPILAAGPSPWDNRFS